MAQSEQGLARLAAVCSAAAVQESVRSAVQGLVCSAAVVRVSVQQVAVWR